MLLKRKTIKTKIFSVVIAAIMLMGMMPTQFAFAVEGSAKLTISSSFKAGPGSQILVPIELTSTADINNCDFVVSYDTSKLTFVEVTPGSIVKDAVNNFSANNSATLGQINFLFNDESTANDKFITDDGTFATMKFTVKADAAVGTTTPISFKSVGSFSQPDAALTDIFVETQNGSVAILATIQPSITAASGKTSNNVVVPVNLGSIPTAGVRSCTFTVAYDSAKLTFVKAEPGTLVPDAAGFTANPVGSEVSFTYNDVSGALNQPLTGTGTVAKLTFKINGTAAVGTTAVNVTKATNLLDGNNKELNASTATGNVTIAAETTAPTMVLPSASVTLGKVLVVKTNRHGKVYVVPVSALSAAPTKDEIIAKAAKVADTQPDIDTNIDTTGLDVKNKYVLYTVDETGNLSAGSAPVSLTVDECFIATAAYGSKFMPAVSLLRSFRDDFLLTNPVGQAFVKFYYKNSPPIANFIAGNEILRVVVRILLTPFVAIAYALYNPVLAAALLAIAAMAIRKKKLVKSNLV